MARVSSFTANVKTESSTDPITKLGTLREFPDGSKFRYTKNGAVALVAGRLVQSVVPTANHLNIACAATAAGATSVTVTLGATAVTANEYADGYIFINDAGADTSTEGYTYRIKEHPAADASATLALTLYNDSPVIIALTANSEATLVHNPFRNVIIHPSPPTSMVVGVAPRAIDANEYFWLQTAGPCAVLTSGTLVAGDFCVPGATVDGSVMPSAAVETDGPPVGRVMTVNADTEESLIYLTLD